MKTLPSRRVRKAVRYVALLAGLLATWERRVLLDQTTDAPAGRADAESPSAKAVVVGLWPALPVAWSWEPNHHRRPVR